MPGLVEALAAALLAYKASAPAAALAVSATAAVTLVACTSSSSSRSSTTSNMDLLLARVATILGLPSPALTPTTGPVRVLARDTPAYRLVTATTVENRTHLVCWPAATTAPVLHVAWSTGDKPTVDAELLPVFLTEDEAIAWHTALRDAVGAGAYSAAKEQGDAAFVDADGTRPRGIGGVRAFVPSVETVHAIAAAAVAAYVDVASACAIKTDAEVQWASSRAFAIARDLALPAGATPTFPAISAIDPTPRRALLLAASLGTPRPSYLAEPLFIRALRGATVPRPPVWLHRQAGRYLPEYREVKNGRNLLEMVADPSCACEITLQPVRRYGVDCAILFSDIMTIPIALGMDVEMRPGPYFPHPLESDADVAKLAYNPAYMNDVYAALKLVRAELDETRAVVGFCGAPWTCVAYMVGKDKAKAWAHRFPHRAHAALRKCTAVAIDFLVKQYAAGADVLQVFESQAADLGPKDFRQFALPYLTEIAREVKKACPHAPMTVFPRGAAHYATKWIAEGTQYDCVSVDWGTEPRVAREMAGEDLTLQGNLEPDVLYEPVENIKREVRAMITEFGGTKRYIVNLGHGTKPDMSVEAVGAFVEEAQRIV
ncbi:hypothetical protein GGF32_004697 [Allomyces javanicus]|nr:hypothetical protein GGF32_004697 [Allomyces javanicus]